VNNYFLQVLLYSPCCLWDCAHVLLWLGTGRLLFLSPHLELQRERSALSHLYQNAWRDQLNSGFTPANSLAVNCSECSECSGAYWCILEETQACLRQLRKSPPALPPLQLLALWALCTRLWPLGF